MNCKIIIALLLLVTSGELPLLPAAEPIKKESITAMQAQAATDIAEAILHDNSEQVTTLFQKFFAKDMTLSPDHNIEDQRVLAYALIDVVKTSLTLFSDATLTSLKNESGKQFFRLIPNVLRTIHQPVFEKLGMDTICHISSFLPYQTILNFMLTSVEAWLVLKHMLEERHPILTKAPAPPLKPKLNLYQHWSNGHIACIDLLGHGQQINALAFSHDGKILVSGSDDRRIILWDASTGRKLKELIGHTGAITSVDFSPNDTTIVSAGIDGTIRLWDVEAGQEYRQFLGIKNCYNRAVFSHNGKYLAYTSHIQHNYTSVKTRNLETAEENYFYFKQTVWPWQIIQISFSLDDKILSVVTNNGQVTAWNRQSQHLDIIQPEPPTQYYFTHHCVDSGGLQLNSLCRDQIRGPFAVTLSHDLAFFQAGLRNETIIFNTESKQITRGLQESCIALSYSPDDTLLAAISARKLTILPINRQIDLNGNGSTVSFSPDGESIAVGLENGDIKLIRRSDPVPEP